MNPKSSLPIRKFVCSNDQNKLTSSSDELSDIVTKHLSLLAHLWTVVDFDDTDFQPWIQRYKLVCVDKLGRNLSVLVGRLALQVYRTYCDNQTKYNHQVVIQVKFKKGEAHKCDDWEMAGQATKQKKSNTGENCRPTLFSWYIRSSKKRVDRHNQIVAYYSFLTILSQKTMVKFFFFRNCNWMTSQ